MENKKTKRNKIMIISYILVSVALYISGFILLITTTITGNFEKDYIPATVTEVSDSILVVQSGENNGDPIIYELKRHEKNNINVGDDVYIKVVGNKVKYSVTNISPTINIGVLLIIISTILFILGSDILLIIFAKKSQSIHKKIAIICFTIGMTILVFFAETNRFDTFMILGLSLCIIPSIIHLIMDKKDKKMDKNNINKV